MYKLDAPHESGSNCVVFPSQPSPSRCHIASRSHLKPVNFEHAMYRLCECCVESDSTADINTLKNNVLN